MRPFLLVELLFFRTSEIAIDTYVGGYIPTKLNNLHKCIGTYNRKSQLASLDL